LISVEPEIIQCAPANRICVLVLRERLTLPGYANSIIINSPGRAAIALVIKRPVVCPAGFLSRRVKAKISYVGSRCVRHTERLNGAIEVLVVQSVLITPHPGGRVSHFVSHKPDAIVPRVRLNLIHRGASSCPSHNSRLHSHGRCRR
jgi:hypothetical protein